MFGLNVRVCRANIIDDFLNFNNSIQSIVGDDYDYTVPDWDRVNDIASYFTESATEPATVAVTGTEPTDFDYSIMPVANTDSFKSDYTLSVGVLCSKNDSISGNFSTNDTVLPSNPYTFDSGRKYWSTDFNHVWLRVRIQSINRSVLVNSGSNAKISMDGLHVSIPTPSGVSAIPDPSGAIVFMHDIQSVDSVGNWATSWSRYGVSFTNLSVDDDSNYPYFSFEFTTPSVNYDVDNIYIAIPITISKTGINSFRYIQYGCHQSYFQMELIDSNSENVGLLRSIIEWLTNILNSIKNGFSGVVNAVQNVVSSISELPSKIIELLKSALQYLFIPSDEQVHNLTQSAQGMLNLGFLSQVSGYIDRIVDSISSGSTDYSIDFPKITVNILGNNFNFGGWVVKLWPTGLNVLMETCRTISSIVVTLIFIVFCKSMLYKFLG